MSDEKTEFTNGELVYLDVFLCPPVPAKVLGYMEYENIAGKHHAIVVKLTAARGAYRHGEVGAVPVSSVVKRKHVRRSNGKYVVRTWPHADVSKLTELHDVKWL